MTITASMIDCNIRPVIMSDKADCLITAAEQSPTSATELMNEWKVDAPSSEEDDQLVKTLEANNVPGESSENEAGESEHPSEDSAPRLSPDEDSSLPEPSPVKAEVRKSIAKGRAELTRSRQKVHAGKLEGSVPASPASMNRSPSNRKLLSASAQSPSSRPRVGRSKSDDLVDVPVRSTSEHTANGRPAPLQRFASSRGFTVESEHKFRHSSHAGSLATPKRRNPKKLSLEDMEKLNKASADLNVLCTPKRSNSTDRKLRVDICAMMGEGTEDLTKSPRRRQLPKRSKSTRSADEKFGRVPSTPRRTKSYSKGEGNPDKTKGPTTSESSILKTAKEEVNQQDNSSGTDTLVDKDTAAPFGEPGTVLAVAAAVVVQDNEKATPMPEAEKECVGEEDRASEESLMPSEEVTSDSTDGNPTDTTTKSVEIQEGAPVDGADEPSQKDEVCFVKAAIDHSSESPVSNNNEDSEGLFGSDTGQKQQEYSANESFEDLANTSDSNLQNPNETSLLSQGFSTSAEGESGEIADDWAFGSDNPFTDVATKDKNDPSDVDTELIKKRVPAGKGPWTCASCLYRNKDKLHLFCGMCGTGRDWCCPSCDTENMSTFKFCSNCGIQKGRPIKNPKSKEAEGSQRDHRLSSRKVSKCLREKPKAKEKNVDHERRSRPVPRQNSKKSDGESRENRGELSPPVNEEDKRLEKRSNRGRSRATKELKLAPSRKMERRSSMRSKDGEGLEEGRRKRRSKSRTDEKRSDRPRRMRNSASLPPGERNRNNSTSLPSGERTPSEDVLPLKNEVDQSSCELLMEFPRSNSLNEQDQASGWDNPASPSDGEDIEGKSLRQKKALALKKPWKSSDERESILSNDMNSTDHGLRQPKGRDRGTEDRLDVLATPSIKKRLLKMGKFGGKKMNTPDLLVSEHLGSDTDAANSRKAISYKADGLVPTTPGSLKKRLLKKIPWGGKTDDSQPQLPHNEEEASVQEMPVAEGEQSDLFEASGSPHATGEMADSSEESLEPFSGFVFTAKDVRSNRPVTSQRQKVTSEKKTSSNSRYSNAKEGPRSSRPDKKAHNRHPDRARRAKHDDQNRKPHLGEHHDSGNTSEMGSSLDQLEDF